MKKLIYTSPFKYKQNISIFDLFNTGDEQNDVYKINKDLIENPKKIFSYTWFRSNKKRRIIR